MRNPVFSLADMISGFAVDDVLFADAYQASADGERALMKTCIARLHDWYGPRKDTAGQVGTSWRGGFDSLRRFEPVDFALVLFDEALVSPARLLAALTPAAACGVGQILAVRVGGKGAWARSLLTGMELAGQELVADMPRKRVVGLLEELAALGASGAVVDLCAERVACPEASRIACFRPFFDGAAAVFLVDEAAFDLDALAFAHPDAAFTVFGADASLPAGFVRGGDSSEAFLDAVRDVAFAPASLTGKALDRARLVLGPGQEGCWVWPGLHPEFFLFHRTAWTIGD